MSWEIQGNKLVGIAEGSYGINPHEFWYVVPARTHYLALAGKKVRPLEFAFVLHNAHIGKGLLPSPTTMLDGMEPNTQKGGVGRDTEIFLEEVRVELFQERPSRLRCYFLNLDKDIATHRMNDTLRGDKKLVQCFIVSNNTKVHFADSRIYEQLENKPGDKNLAIRYWQTFDYQKNNNSRDLEILVDGPLYFPDWQKFPTISQDTFISWQIDNLMTLQK